MMRVRLARLIQVFLLTGLSSFGGGRSAHLHDAVVVRRGWLTNAEFLQSFTLCQVLPGPNFSNLAVTLGYRLAGAGGAAGAAASVLVPGAIVLLILTVIYSRTGLAEDARHFLHGMGAAVVGLLLMTAARLARGALRVPGAVVVAALTFLSVGPLRINTAVVIGVMLPLSLLLTRPRRQAPLPAPPAEPPP